MSRLLPENFDELIQQSVQLFWQTRGRATSVGQGGGRGAVLSGKNLDGFQDVIRSVVVHNGLPTSTVHTNKGAALPGYFRATKDWDVVVVHQQRLLAAWELKSHVGPSFGNNFNNRTEEALGSALDLGTARQEGALGDPRPPFLAWLLLLEDCPGSTRPVRIHEPHFSAFPEFQGASYSQRYKLLCERMVRKRLYDGAALLLSSRAGGLSSGQHRALSPATTVRAVFQDFAARIVAAV